ncbi:MAG: caspase family protein [Ferruginibacter sp.]
MLLKRISILLLLFITHFCTKAQSFYHIQYNLKETGDSTVYNAFLVMYEDGTGVMRLRYMNHNQDAVMEYDAEQEPVLLTSGLEDSNHVLLNFINPRMIVGKQSGVLVPKIILSSTAEPGIMEPNGMLAAGYKDLDKDRIHAFSSRFITMPELQKNYLLQFYSEDEDFFTSLFKPVTRGLTAVEKNTMLHLFIVANTLEKTIGGSCAQDMDRTLKTFADLTNYLGIKLIVDSVSGTRYNRKNVEVGLKNINPGPNDIVVFYYSGHGFRKKGSPNRFPNIDLRAKPTDDYLQLAMSMDDIYKIIKKKGARINLVMSDCCNDEVEKTNTIGSKPLKTKGSGVQWNEDNLRQLFFNKTPMSIIATAADTTQRAAGNNNFGGFFTYFFKTSLENNCSVLKNPTWDVVMQSAIAQTSVKARHTYCSKPYVAENICRQSPIYKIDLGR